MTYKKANEDFYINGIYCSQTNESGENILDEIDFKKVNIPDDTEGKIIFIPKGYNSGLFFVIEEKIRRC